MAIRLSVEAELGPAIQWTGKMMAQLPFATSVALNKTAYQLQQTLNYETTRYFDRPTPFTQRSFRFTKSTKTNLEVTVGTAPIQSRYLRFGIAGGARPAKGFELKFLADLVDKRSIPSSAQLVPTSQVPVNSYGNVTLSTLRQIQRGLSTTWSREDLQGLNARGAFFYGKPRGGGRNASLPAGIYRRSRLQLFPYFVSIQGRAQYQPQFPVAKISNDKAQQVFGPLLRASLDQAMKTAR